TPKVALNVHYLGQWPTPWWEDGVDKGPKIRAGFMAETVINRHDFGVNWNSTPDRGGVVVSNAVQITLDAEAIRDDALHNEQHCGFVVIGLRSIRIFLTFIQLAYASKSTPGLGVTPNHPDIPWSFAASEVVTVWACVSKT